MPKYFDNQRGVTHLILLISVLGLLAFLLISNTFSFKDRLFSSLFPKASFFAQEANQATVVTSRFSSNELLIKFKKDVRGSIKEDPKDIGVASLNATLNKYKVKKFERVAKVGKNSKTDAEVFGWYKVTIDVPQDRIEGRFDHALGIIQTNPSNLKSNEKARVKKDGSLGASLLQDLINKLKSDSAIEAVDLNYVIEAFKVPNDPYYASSGSWGQGFQDLWGMHKINLEPAWDQATGSASIVVAGIDTGVDRNHEDIKDNMWVNSAEIPNNGVDDDGNGYIDDYYGWNYVAGTNDPMDDHGHGTHTVGTIAGVGNNGIGVVGVNWVAKIMALKFLDANGSGYTASGIRALQYAADMGARVSSNSWGCSCNDAAMDDAVKYEHDRGMVMVAAAGNSNADAIGFSPASADYAITVAASDSNDAKASFSNWGEKIDVAAPGVDILSIRASNNPMCDSSRTVGINYCRVSGTSMAAPHVAGLAALLLSKNPSLTNEEVRQIIRSGAIDLGTAGKDASFGYGRINGSGSMSLANHVLAPVIASPLSRTTVSGSTLQVIGGVPGPNFASYKVEVGAGRAPTSWTSVTTSNTQVTDGVLATIDTTRQMNEGQNIIRVTATDTSGKNYQFQVEDIFIDNFDASINFPFGLMSLGPIDVLGAAQTKNGLGFGSYKLEWGAGASPTSWSTSGITLENGGNLPVVNGKLGSWDTLSLTNGQNYTLRLTVNSSAGTSTQYTVSVTADKDLVKGWPKILPAVGGNWFGNAVSAMDDLDGDGTKEVIALAPAGKVYVYKKDGSDFPGFPVSVDSGFYPNMPVSTVDLDGDGKKEIVVSASNLVYFGYVSKIFIFKSDGSLYPGWTSPALSVWGDNGGHAVADLDGDGKKELVVLDSWLSPNAQLHAYRLDGSELVGFPKTISSGNTIYYFGAPSIADVNSDGKPEIAVGINEKLYVFDNGGNLLPGWPYSAVDQYQDLIGNMPVTFVSSPAFGDMNGDGVPEILAVGHLRSCTGCDGFVYAVKKDGSILAGWPIRSGALPGEYTVEGPSAADIDNDGKDDMAVENYLLRVYGANGLKLTGTPVTGLAPSISDVDGDGKLEYSFVNSTDVGVIDNNGQIYFDKYVYNYGRYFHTPPVFADLDNNGKMEMLAMNDRSGYYGDVVYYLWEVPAAGTAKYEWPMFGHDSARSGRLLVALQPTPPPTPTPTPAPPDTTPPTVSITSPTNGSTLPSKGSVKVNATASDSSGISSIEIFIDNASVKLCSAVTTCQYSWPMTKVSTGTHTIKAVAKDNSANKNSNNTSISVTK